MKKILAALLLLMVTCIASAQQYMRIWQNGDDTRVGLQDITWSDSGSTFSIDGTAYQTASVDSITMVHIITVSYDGSTATVDMGNVENVTCTTDGADVSIVSENNATELEVVLQGTTTNGSLTYTGNYKCKFYLNGVSLTSQTGAALDIECGKRVALELVSGTTNTLADAASGSQKAALYCKGHLEITGSGSLSVSGNAKHAISTKEYLELKKSTGSITILNAAADAMHVGQYFLMNGGTLTIDGNTMADGIQVEPILLDDDVTLDTSKEYNGQVFIKGGSINATITHEDCKAIRNDVQDFAISGGTLTLQAQGNGSRGIQTGGNMTISAADNTTSITITAAGGLCTQSEDADDPHRCMGIKVDGNLTVSGGTTKVTNTGKKSRGIKVGGTYKKTGGTVSASITY